MNTSPFNNDPSCAAPNAAAPSCAEKLSFVEAISHLEQIVSALESGRCELEESLAQYEAGIRLVRRCRAQLADAEQRIERLKNFDADGNIETEPVAEGAFQSDTSVPGRGDTSAQGAAKVSKPVKLPKKSKNSPSRTETTGNESLGDVLPSEHATLEEDSSAEEDSAAAGLFDYEGG